MGRRSKSSGSDGSDDSVTSSEPTGSSVAIEQFSEGVLKRTRITFSIEDVLEAGVRLSDVFPPASERVEHALTKDINAARKVLRAAKIPTGAAFYRWCPDENSYLPSSDARCVTPSCKGEKIFEGRMPGTLGWPLGTKQVLAGELLEQAKYVQERFAKIDDWAEFAEANQRLGELRAAFQASTFLYHKDVNGRRTAVEAAEAGAASRGGRVGIKAKWKIDERDEISARLKQGQSQTKISLSIKDKYSFKSLRHVEKYVKELAQSQVLDD